MAGAAPLMSSRWGASLGYGAGALVIRRRGTASPLRGFTQRTN